MISPNAMVTSRLNQMRQELIQNLTKSGIPQDVMNDPNALIQYLMNSGKLTQNQYNSAVQMAKQFQNLR